MSKDSPQITLYSSPVSNCAARLRIALNLKSLPYTLHTVNLSKGDHLEERFFAVNPGGTVPCLVVRDNNLSASAKNDSATSIGQSIAALEFLDEAFPEAYPLLPPDQPHLRAKVRSLVGILASDTHPLLTVRVKQNIQDSFPGIDIRDNSKVWSRNCIERGLAKFESLGKECCGRYSVGDEITMADVVLVPEVWYALRLGISLEQFSNVKRIFENVCERKNIAKEQTIEEEL